MSNFDNVGERPEMKSSDTQPVVNLGDQTTSAAVADQRCAASDQSCQAATGLTVNEYLLQTRQLYVPPLQLGDAPPTPAPGADDQPPGDKPQRPPDKPAEQCGLFGSQLYKDAEDLFVELCRLYREQQGRATPRPEDTAPRPDENREKPGEKPSTEEKPGAKPKPKPTVAAERGPLGGRREDQPMPETRPEDPQPRTGPGRSSIPRPR